MSCRNWLKLHIANLVLRFCLVVGTARDILAQSQKSQRHSRHTCNIIHREGYDFMYRKRISSQKNSF